MSIFQLAFIVPMVVVVVAVQFQVNPTSAMSADEKSFSKDNKTMEQSDESGHEVETDLEEKDKRFLDDAMKTILDPNSVILKNSEIDKFKMKLDEVDQENMTLEVFMEEMDKLSLDVCKTSQQALWSYVTDINNENKKNRMVRIAAVEDEIKKQYWNILKRKYLERENAENDPQLVRKLRIIKERGTNVQMPQSKQREEIDTMQRIWSRVTLCAYNITECNSEDSIRTMSDVIAVFKTSNDSKELAYYWKSYRDSTGRKIRPIFKDYVMRMNNVAESENFTDAGDMWRFAFEDDHFVHTVGVIWQEIKPFYNLLHNYVRNKLKAFYKEDLQDENNLIPAHILGNLWAQDWQTIYTKVAAYPEHIHPDLLANESIHSKLLFDAVDDFHVSLGFDSAKDSYENIRETMATENCLPSSHDMCDGVHYKIKWCGEKVTDVVLGLSRAARLLGHVQYFKHYRHQPPLYRDGPNPAFHDAISDIVAVQITAPDHLKTLNLVNADVGPEVTINHLLWVALEKFPLMAYAYVLDNWRWDVFGNSSLENWNEHWWNLRIRETGVSPPVARNESDLDPAAKYHVVSHVQYITYLVSHILEFQILRSICRHNYTGPLHECSIYGAKEAGKLLSDGMSMGASENWRRVLEVMTGETELSTAGILEYFAPLKEFLEAENSKLLKAEDDMDQRAPIIVGCVVALLTFIIIVLYCVKKHNVGSRVLSVCGLSKNGSLDIVTNELPRGKNSEVGGISEDKV